MATDHAYRFVRYLPALVAAFGPLGCQVLFRSSAEATAIHTADRLRRSDNPLAAIPFLERHIAERLADSRREQWENPHFHRLTIGDIYREQGDEKKAMNEYRLALRNGVDQALVIDRIIQIAEAVHARSESDNAINILLEFRSLDPLLIDTTIDKIARDIVAKEDNLTNAHE